MQFKVGVIADTHGLLRPEAIKFLERCDLIMHAGDIGNSDILRELKSIAPTFAIRGNVDWGSWANELPTREVIEAEDKFFYLIHSIDDLDLDPNAAGFDAVIFGHSHQPTSYKKDGVLYFNPGSAGHRRFKLPISIGRITVINSDLKSDIVTLIE